MKSLILVAHGSRREASNDEVRSLTKQLSLQIKQSSDQVFDDVDCAFLELAKPLIPDGIRCAIQRGAEKVVVLPYFLSAGRHVVEDIPGDVAVVQEEFPDVDIVMSSYLGETNGITDLLIKQAVAAL